MTANKMTANDMINILTAKPAGWPVPRWVAQAAVYQYPTSPLSAGLYETTAVNFFTEVTVRPPRPGKTRRGNPRFQRRRFDLVALVQPHYRQWKPFAIGIEIKVDVHDLRNDQKMMQYLDYCHMFYLAVPPRLVAEGINFIRGNMDMGRAGLLVVDDQVADGIVREEIRPGPLVPLAKNIAELYAELLIRPFRLAKKECKLFFQNERVN